MGRAGSWFFAGTQGGNFDGAEPLGMPGREERMPAGQCSVLQGIGRLCRNAIQGSRENNFRGGDALRSPSMLQSHAYPVAARPNDPGPEPSSRGVPHRSTEAPPTVSMPAKGSRPPPSATGLRPPKAKTRWQKGRGQEDAAYGVDLAGRRPRV